MKKRTKPNYYTNCVLIFWDTERGQVLEAEKFLFFNSNI